MIQLLKERINNDPNSWKITKEEISNYSSVEIISSLSELIENGTITFPYKKYFIGCPSDKFRALKEYNRPIERMTKNNLFLPGINYNATPFLLHTNRYKNHQALLIVTESNDYNEINCISDIYQEHARMNSIAGTNAPETPLELWKNKKTHHIYAPFDILNYEHLREKFYEISRYLETSTFRSTVAKSIYTFLSAKRILDFSSGWGDRLIAAVSLEDTIDYYVGVDPNSELFSGYSSMIMLAKEQNRKKYTMINSPFETCNSIPYKKFDCIFTSPPYYNYERYGTGENSSITNYSKHADWVVNFLFASIEKSWDMLEPYGHFAINISDAAQLIKQKNNFTEVTLLLMIGYLNSIVYHGVINFVSKDSSGKPSRHRPIWVFQKVPCENKMAHFARAQIKKDYATISNMIVLKKENSAN